MDDSKFRQNLALYIEKTDFGIQSQTEIVTSVRIQSLSKSKNTAKMLIRFKIKPEWLNEQQFVPAGLLISLFDVSSTIVGFYFDTRLTSSISMRTSILGTASLNDEVSFDLTLQEYANNSFNIISTISCKEKIIAKCQHIKLPLNNTSWVPKL